MSIILKNLKKIYDSNVVLENVNLSLNQGEKITIIGDNGAGKTTLLKILAGTEELSSGNITRDNYSETLIVTQEFPQEFIKNAWSVKEYIDYHGGEKLERSVLRILKNFGLNETFLDLNLKYLSGGQKKILDLSTAFARKPQYLLLDEPENHIDIFGRQTLIELMKNFRGCLAFVSHDQDLINSVTNRILEVTDGELKSYTGTYDFFLEEKDKQEQAQKKNWKHHQSEVKHLDALVKRMREWVKKNPDLGPMLRAKKTQLERLHENAPKKPKSERRMKLNLNEVEQKKTKIILQIEDFYLTLGNQKLFSKANAYLTFGQKVAFVGRNGTGKTSLLKVILGQLDSNSGVVRLGVNIKVGYFSQSHFDSIDEKQTPLQLLSDIMYGPEHQLRSVLAKFLIGENAYNRPVNSLSGGQKTRLRFCLLFNQHNELLLLDEPTNHLDNTSWNVLVTAIQDYSGSVLMVSHDRVFIDQTSNKLWILEDQQIDEYTGTLTEYLSE